MEKYKIITYLVTALSITGTAANSLHKRWCFYLWGITNTFWVVYNGANGQYAQSMLYAFNFIMCIVGLKNWKKEDKK